MDSLPTSGKIEDFCNTVFHADALDLLRALPDCSIDLICTDFPYQKTQAFYDKPDLDFVAIGKEMFRVIRPNGAVISTAAQPFTSRLVMLWEKYFQYEWIWRKTRKTNFLNAPYEPLSAHESVLVFGNKRPQYYPQMIAGKMQKKGTNTGSILWRDFKAFDYTNDTYYPDTVLEFAHDPELSITKTQRPNKLETHPNQKPVKLWEFLLSSYTLQGDITLDPFAGSSTTAIACMNLERRWICSDNHLPYVKLSRERIARHNPFVDTPLKTGEKQLSLFRDLEKQP